MSFAFFMLDAPCARLYHHHYISLPRKQLVSVEANKLAGAAKTGLGSISRPIFDLEPNFA